MPNQSVTWTEPVLCHHNHDMAKPWFVYFTFTDHKTGKTVRVQKRNGINYLKRKDERLKDGNALIAYLKDKLESGWNPITDETGMPTDAPETIRDAIQRVLDLKASSLKKKSKQGYADITGMFLKWTEKYGYDKLPLYKFSNKIAQAYMDYLLLERKYAGKTHNGQLGILKAFGNVIVKRWREILAVNPFLGIDEMPENVGRNVAYTEKEARALMLWLKQIDIRTYYAANIMFHCYIRKTELCELRVRDFNWQERTIIINSDSAKNRKQESVTIPEALLPILEEMNLRDYPGDYFVFGHLMETSAKHISKADILSDRHKRAVDRIKNKHKKSLAFFFENEDTFNTIAAISPDKTFYSWKHTGVVMYWHVVKDVYYIMRQLRHYDMQTTMIYLKSLGLLPNDAFRNANVQLL